ncbi:MAG: hypothetical protein MUF42_12800 [Cytophagaceae bacterium]|jgi:hypothetical protein|nr:hypothetical protein [Cytophagaceae bacterium]
MGKRLHRYYGAQLEIQLYKSLQKRVALVLKDNSVHDGVLIKCQPHIQLKDKLGRLHTLEVSQLLELILDEEADY